MTNLEEKYQVTEVEMRDGIITPDLSDMSNFENETMIIDKWFMDHFPADFVRYEGSEPKSLYYLMVDDMDKEDSSYERWTWFFNPKEEAGYPLVIGQNKETKTFVAFIPNELGEKVILGFRAEFG